MVTVLLFPGQGAQKPGMARDLADKFPAAAATLEQIDAALDTSLTDVMWNGSAEDLTLTHNAQPAILAHSAAVLSVVQERLGDTVVAAAGHSLGEYSAYIATGSLEAPAAARLVRRRGTLMFEAGELRPGTMAAVIGLEVEGVRSACQEASAGNGGTVVAANLNAPDQTVISGDPSAVERAGELCKAAGAKRVLPLKVSGAFHSPLMAPAQDGLREAIRVTAFGEPRFPVFANATADAVTGSDDAQKLLVEQIIAPVRWVETMQAIHARWPDARWLELGPGSVLSGLLRRIVPTAQCTALGTAEEVGRFLAL
jgi:[acyl-carrier-protein] S-malonyltransferase